ncbi:tetratricopeptide repeat protein [Streptomyces sp. WAC 05379]|uniref:FxSxx-COOH system tetratricopeptide repeat protein n=1 Tax=Streptomyces sp. WAC 05379 TaxID=2203207 RepID=UPI000F739055|nr:FxSxx-COOH system tetratricopeptide repeat protein [Streptomyces sp. WAC 05379]RSO09600.1 tetratricopeptide repeat protein [Streptomyces sp. WAC 05379]
MNAEQLTLVQQRMPREPAAWPHQVGIIPPRAQSFQHRAEVDHLRAVVEDSGTTVLRQVSAGRVLAGMGGVGKTQLAADYARTAWADDSLDVLVWVTASSRSAVVTGYAQAGVELCRASLEDPEQAAQTFLAWLTPKAGAQPCRWLIVLDDVGDPDDLRGMWPPTSPCGRALVTTRRRDASLAGDGRRLFKVGLFTEAEAVSYLTTSLATHGRSEPAHQLAALAADLGHLPLALSQTAAYLADSGESVADYRRLFADRTTTLADAAPDRLPDDQALPLAASWSLSIDRADALRPTGLARPMLYLCALLDANGIPQGVLTSQPVLDHLAAQRTPTDENCTAESVPVSPRDAVRALRALHRLHLVNHAPDTPHLAVRVHQLIQHATRDTLTSEQHASYTRIVADALKSAWPEIERDAGLAQALQANVTALCNTTEQALWQRNAHPVLFHAGTRLGESGQATAALAYWQYMIAAATHYLGPDHPDALTSRHRLAHWQGLFGDVNSATLALEHLLSDQQRILGPDHPDTLTTRYDLARWRGAAGDVTGTITAFEELLNDRARVLGPEHIDTMDTRHDLAFWRGKGGDPVGAVIELKEVLLHTLRTLGPDHPDTFICRQNIAFFTGESGDLTTALTLYKELLGDSSRVFGPSHRAFLDVATEFAFWRGKAGDPATAANELEQLIAVILRVVDPADPCLPYARRYLASCQGAAGDPSAAVATLEESLHDPRRGFGPDHPHTLGSRRDLAHWRGTAGDPAAAASELEQLIPHMLRVLGPDHPDTLQAQQDLVRWHAETEG